MGKRELLLIVVFVIVGVVVYQATAPPPGPNERSFSLSKIIEAARREIRGNRAVAETTSTSTLAIGEEVTELRVVGFLTEVQITGEDRATIETSLRVSSHAYNETEAKQFANDTVLKTDRAAASVVMSVGYVKGRQTGRQRASLLLKVPSRLRVRVESRPDTLTIANVSGVEATNVGGNASIRKIGGRVTVVNRGGQLVIEDAAALKLTARGSDVTVTGIRGDASIAMEQGGELTATRLAGPLDVEARNAEIILDDLELTRGPIRVNAVNGTVRLKGITADTRVDGRNSELDVLMSAPAPIAIYSEGEDVSLTPPPAGYRLDAVVIDGRIAPEALLDELGLQHAIEAETKESRASGPVNGGGPVITVRATRGNLTLRARDPVEQDK